MVGGDRGPLNSSKSSFSKNVSYGLVEQSQNRYAFVVTALNKQIRLCWQDRSTLLAVQANERQLTLSVEGVLVVLRRGEGALQGHGVEGVELLRVELLPEPRPPVAEPHLDARLCQLRPGKSTRIQSVSIQYWQ